MRNKKYLLRRKGFSVKKALLSIGVVASIGLAFSHSTEILESALANSATENVEKTQTNNVLSHPIVQKEQNAALNALINRWQEKSPEEIKEELLRQEEAGSIAYVVQWGDTLPNIASAAGLTVNELLDLNGLSSDYHINTSDVLIGLIDNQGIHVKLVHMTMTGMMMTGMMTTGTMMTGMTMIGMTMTGLMTTGTTMIGMTMTGTTMTVMMTTGITVMMTTGRDDDEIIG